MLVITRLRFVGVAKPIQLNSGLAGRHVLVKLRKSSELGNIHLKRSLDEKFEAIPNLYNLPCK